MLTRTIFEQPWPAAIALLIVAGAIAYTALREGLTKRLFMSAIPAGIALVILAVGTVVVTPGEHARRTVRAFVEAVESNDVRAAKRFVAPFAVVNSRDANAPGIELIDLLNRVNRFGRYTVEENRITKLSTATVSPRRGEVQIAVRTTVDVGVAGTSWQFRVEEQTDGSWRIVRLTWLTLHGSPAPSVDRLE
ncbi:MAG: hypothetical protein AAF432_10210 [Planctomycetota bacterium]